MTRKTIDSVVTFGMFSIRYKHETAKLISNLDDFYYEVSKCKTFYITIYYNLYFTILPFSYLVLNT